MRVLDEVLPRFEFESRHAIHVDAPPEQTWQALLEVRAQELLLTRTLMGVRALPGRLRGKRGLLPADSTITGALPGAVQLVHDDFELALGLVGRFWDLTARPLPMRDRAEFEEFDTPGYAKAAFALAAQPEGAGTRLETSTRIVTTDAAARRSFGRYWFVIRAGSGLIRRDMLRAIKRRAERRSGPDRRAAR